ncbi:MAG: electron transport complex subunit RsxA [Actinobacteria bacterium]|nr:electron transport complex subunit RsxA [Actinomycetota bacterium]
MSEPYRYFLIFLGAVLVYNIILIRFIALCPLIGVSTKVETSIGMAMSVLFVMTMATTVSWIAWNYILEPLGVGEFLYIPAFILIIAALVQFVEMVIKKVSTPLYRAMGIYLPLITTNCAVLAAATEAVKPGFLKLNVPYHFGLLEAIIYTVGVALGFGIIIIMFACIRERLETSPVPHSFRGAPIAFMTATLLSLAFMGFANLLGL